jgi:hypothetical protein
MLNTQDSYCDDIDVVLPPKRIRQRIYFIVLTLTNFRECNLLDLLSPALVSLGPTYSGQQRRPQLKFFSMPI